MYEELFRSATRPFRATPDVNLYYAHQNVRMARETVVRAVERAEGPCLVLGGAGLGKSMLASLIAQDLQGQFDIVKLHASSLCSRKALLQSILFELGLPYADLSEGELRLSIFDRMEPGESHAPAGIVVLVDEAHTLPTKLLEELRLISNFSRDNQPRARLVLLGSLRLEDTFSSPQLESFNQRLAARCYLTPMTRQETIEFVCHQLLQAGQNPETFITEDGLDAVYAASEGVPRIANQVMDHSMVLAAANGESPIHSGIVEEAWADLQQLPVPWLSPTQAIEDSSPVEFGSLSEEVSEVFDNEPGRIEDYQEEFEVQPGLATENDYETINPEAPKPVVGNIENVEFAPLDEPENVAASNTESTPPESVPGAGPQTEIQPTNFFAAFSEPEAGELPEFEPEAPTETPEAEIGTSDDLENTASPRVELETTSQSTAAEMLVDDLEAGTNNFNHKFLCFSPNR